MAGQILESSERHCIICRSRSSRFLHIALTVIVIILGEKDFGHIEFPVLFLVGIIMRLGRVN